jgi:hypothetical protein
LQSLATKRHTGRLADGQIRCLVAGDKQPEIFEWSSDTVGVQQVMHAVMPMNQIDMVTLQRSGSLKENTGPNKSAELFSFLALQPAVTTTRSNKDGTLPVNQTKLTCRSNFHLHDTGVIGDRRRRRSHAKSVTGRVALFVASRSLFSNRRSIPDASPSYWWS